MLPRLKQIQMSLEEKNMDWNSLFQLFCMKASPAQVKMHDVFTENADLLLSHEWVEQGIEKGVALEKSTTKLMAQKG